MAERSWHHWNPFKTVCFRGLWSGLPWLKGRGTIETQASRIDRAIPCSSLPWLKGHGTIETCLHVNNEICVYSYHGWKVVALLKLGYVNACDFFVIVTMSEMTWLHWNSISASDTAFLRGLPCLKSRGSIETGSFGGTFPWYDGYRYHGCKVVAPLKQSLFIQMKGSGQVRYHGWKVVAPLKHPNWYSYLPDFPITMAEKSWLHWNPWIWSGKFPENRITMAEKSWLHWNEITRSAWTSRRTGYHGWKDVAPLKPPWAWSLCISTLGHHIWKDVALLKCRHFN